MSGPDGAAHEGDRAAAITGAAGVDGRNAPFVYLRRVRWGDGDAARIAYTVRLADFTMEAVEDWFRRVLGFDWYRLNVELGLGSPVVHLAFDFHSPVVPGDRLAITVLVKHLGASSITFDLSARLPDGRVPFRATSIHALVDNARMKAVRIPDEFRSRIEAYMQRSDGSPRTTDRIERKKILDSGSRRSQSG